MVYIQETDTRRANWTEKKYVHIMALQLQCINLNQ